MTALPKALQTFFDAWTRFDTPGYVGVFADGFVEKDPYGGTTTREGLMEHARLTDQNWSKLDYRIDDMVESGGVIALNYTAWMTGKDGAPWAGKTVELKCMAFVEIEDDRIKRWDETFDTGVMRRAAKR